MTDRHTFKPGDRVSTGHVLKMRLKKSPHPSRVVNDTDCRAWEYEGGGWDYEATFKTQLVTSGVSDLTKDRKSKS